MFGYIVQLYYLHIQLYNRNMCHLSAMFPCPLAHISDAICIMLTMYG